MAANVPELTGIDVRPFAPHLGAEIRGVTLADGVSPEAFAVIHRAFMDYQVLFFKEQDEISPARHIEFGRMFGELHAHPAAPGMDGYPEIFNIIKEAANRSINIGGFWHADVTYRERPHLAAVLYAKETPTFGGDTMFSNQYLAYETLPDEMKKKLLPMRAIHSSNMPHGQEDARFGSVSKNHAPTDDDRKFKNSPLETTKVDVIENAHPVVRTHPETGRKFLYVNRAFTSRFEGMTIEESLPLLEKLWAHSARLEFTCRFRWSPNAVGVWDNRATQHYAINDYFGQRRHMQRIAIHEASRPV